MLDLNITFLSKWVKVSKRNQVCGFQPSFRLYSLDTPEILTYTHVQCTICLNIFGYMNAYSWVCIWNGLSAMNVMYMYAGLKLFIPSHPMWALEVEQKYVTKLQVALLQWILSFLFQGGFSPARLHYKGFLLILCFTGLWVTTKHWDWKAVLMPLSFFFFF